MVNKNYQPLFAATHLCTDHPPEGQRTMSHKPHKQAGAEWFATQRTVDATIASRIGIKTHKYTCICKSPDEAIEP